jgi:hypothetical protein
VIDRAAERPAGAASLDRFPEWARELDARLPVSAQIVLTGNVGDVHVVPAADGQLRLRPTHEVVRECLCQNGYAAILRWHVVTGLSVLHGEPAAELAVPAADGRAQPSARDLADVLGRVVHADARTALVVEGSERLAPDRGDPGLHRLHVVAQHLARTAPRRRHPADGRAGLYNVIVWVVARESDLPHWLLSVDAVQVVSVPVPTLGTRLLASERLAGGLPGYAALDEDRQGAAARTLAEFTEGLPLSALQSVVTLARDRGIPADETESAVRYLRSGLQASPWREPAIRDRIRTAAAKLNEAVLGQPRAVRKTVDILARAALGLSGAQSAGHPGRPQGVLFFAGPTGVGKTELAKRIAEVVFGREDAMVRFDMSEFSAEHTEARLLGAPPGYIGHDAGGELTNAVRQRPFCLLLFDEIDKAHPRILDKFLQILEDGRLSDGSGSTVHFGETLIVFTSNLGIYREDENGRRVPVVEPGTPYADLEAAIRKAIHDEFTLRIRRPELLNRMGDNIVVFDFISAEAARRLLRRNLDNAAREVRRRTGTAVSFGPELVAGLEAAVVEPARLAFGGRAVGSLIESRVVNPLAGALLSSDLDGSCEAVRGWEDLEGFHLDLAPGTGSGAA